MMTSKLHCCQTPESSYQVFSLFFMFLCPKAIYHSFLFSSPQYQFLSFAHLYHCLPSCSLKSLTASGFDKITSFFGMAFIALFFHPRPQMETLWFSFPRSYRLKERRSVNEFLGKFCTVSTSQKHIWLPTREGSYTLHFSMVLHFNCTSTNTKALSYSWQLLMDFGTILFLRVRPVIKDIPSHML